MDENKISADFIVKLDALEKIQARTTLLPPWLFRHEALLRSIESARHIERNNLINAINYINFNDGHVFVLFKHLEYKENILLKAQPQPCSDKGVILRWSQGDLTALKLANYQFQYLVIDDGQSIILIPASIKGIDGNSMHIDLDQAGYEIGRRKAKRYVCHKVAVELNQNGFIAKGNLCDFNAMGFRTKIQAMNLSIGNRFNVDKPVAVHFDHNDQPVFSGMCRIIRQDGEPDQKEIVLEPVDDSINRFRKSPVRNPRRQLIPPPSISFIHPFFNKKVQREINELSNLGFSVYEPRDEVMLTPGMIISDLTIHIHGLSAVHCKCQVIYRQAAGDNGFQCGFAILDMDIEDHSHLTHIISTMIDPHAHISQEVDPEELWKFFFETDFIYPDKYRHLHENRKKLKELHEKIYLGSPEIARHLTYEKNGKIYAHISMLKAYSRSWIVHHFASRNMDSRITSFRIVKQLLEYFNGYSRLPSARTDYTLCYYRPQNEFPDHVFGDYARDMNNFKCSSLDLFSYCVYTAQNDGMPLPQGWSLMECNALDQWELERFYQHRSGGLFLDAIGFKQLKMVDSDLKQQYMRLGLVRKCEAYALAFRGDLAAVLIVDQSTFGLNFSELINGLKIFIVKSEMPGDVLLRAISQLAGVFNQPEVSILIYPHDYAPIRGLEYEKQYQLWILNLRDSDSDYCEYLSRKFRVRLK